MHSTGVHCDIDVNECMTFDPCQNGGNCSNTEGNYTCTCPEGVFGRNCDIAPCSPNPCQRGGQCIVESPDSFLCNCTLGYVGNVCEVADCSAVVCQNGGVCSEDMGTSSWRCICIEFNEGTIFLLETSLGFSTFVGCGEEGRMDLGKFFKNPYIFN